MVWVGALRACHLGLDWCLTRDFTQAREEEGLVNPAIKDRDAHLYAFHDDVAAL
jgi:hypothetical protein